MVIISESNSFKEVTIAMDNSIPVILCRDRKQSKKLEKLKYELLKIYPELYLDGWRNYRHIK